MMKTNGPVEIFILSYNRADSLRDCLQSILQQTFRDFTVTILDNHSEEDIASIVDSFQDNRLKLIVNSTNIGGYLNWMQACNMASTDYMMTFHDDDCMPPRMLERQVQLFKKYPNLSHVSAGVNLVNRKSEMLVFDDVDALDYKIFETPGKMVDAYLFGKEVFGYGSVLYKTHIVKQIQPDNERFLNMADRPYMVSLTTFGPCIQMNVPTYNVRVHSGQDSGTRIWSYLAEIEVGRYYLEMSGKPESFRVRSAIIGILAANYAARHPRAPLREWLRALRERDVFYWQILVLKLPLYLLRDCIKRFIVKIVPNLYAQSVAKRVRRKRAMR
jgi:glycosyltransferase involved in cell wall biosynthesis